jgi:hypothetical protein
VKRSQVLRKIKRGAKAQGVPYSQRQLTGHTGITVGGVTTTVARHQEIPDQFAETIFRQLESALGEGWWRR